ncbi:MAG TPA: DUF169 domain-containing protein [Bacteroidales bacterium]|nr:DUF169 domain-containing protein [Bacteroidales bacterium]
MKHITPDYLIEKTNYNKPVVVVYDAPSDNPFGEVLELKAQSQVCIFAHYKNWMNGKTLRLTATNFGCGGCGTWFFGVQGQSRDNYISFLADDEGLKANHQLMGEWFDDAKRYQPEHDSLFVGPYHADAVAFAKTFTFFVNADQLSIFITAANYFASPSTPDPVKVQFGSGCSELLPHISEATHPLATIGSTDLAMRKFLPPHIMAFTVNKAMFDNLCQLDETSFLNKPFLAGLKKARGGGLV